MMQAKIYSIILFFLLIFNSYSQINFENGYFINNNGEKIECLIKNLDWKNNPTEFEYKSLENAEVKTNSILNVQEFGIIDILKYKRFTVKIDRSDEYKRNHDRNPIFKEETLFLKVLIEGKATLFSFTNGNLYTYFFNLDNSNVEQLVSKNFLNQDDNVMKNDLYKQQIFNSLKCDMLSESDVLRLEYNSEKLAKYFLKFNNCINSNVVNYQQNIKRKTFNLSIRPGISISSLSNDSNEVVFSDLNFGNKFTFRFGIEAEAILPFGKNKWAIFVEPTYKYFKAEKIVNSLVISVDYNMVDFPVGLRHYMFLNDKSKIFVNAAFVFSLDFNSKIDNKTILQNMDINSDSNIDFGIGYNFNNIYSVEFRYGLKRNILNGYNGESNYNSSSLIFGYNIF